MTAAYEQALAFWYGRINYEQVPPCPDDLKLDRMRCLLASLGNPQDRLRIVHVAGSKGKGSTAAMLAHILHCAGYRTGMFTSPHLCRVEERIQVDETPIAPDELTVLLNDVKQAVEGAGGSGEKGMDGVLPRVPGVDSGPTFFEVATAAGFLYFARRRVDVAVVEVGLGGRFDSTNVCRPLVSLITSISFDHTRQLGNRLASIAFEKAGIVKPAIPVVSGVTAPEAARVIDQVCRERCAPLRKLGTDFSYRYQPGVVTAASRRPASVQVVGPRQEWPDMELSLLGQHQAANAAVALACVEELRRQGLAIPETAVVQGLATVQWPARLEVLTRRPLVVLDCAHNVASMEALVATLQSSFPQVPRRLVLACSADKDLPGMLRVLAPHFGHAYLTRYHGSSRSAPPEQLAEFLRQVSDLPATICPSGADAWRAAGQAAGPEELICITGSVFLAGELRPLLQGLSP